MAHTLHVVKKLGTKLAQVLTGDGFFSGFFSGNYLARYRQRTHVRVFKGTAFINAKLVNFRSIASVASRAKKGWLSKLCHPFLAIQVLFRGHKRYVVSLQM